MCIHDVGHVNWKWFVLSYLLCYCFVWLRTDLLCYWDDWCDPWKDSWEAVPLPPYAPSDHETIGVLPPACPAHMRYGGGDDDCEIVGHRESWAPSYAVAVWMGWTCCNSCNETKSKWKECLEQKPWPHNQLLWCY